MPYFRKYFNPDTWMKLVVLAGSLSFLTQLMLAQQFPSRAVEVKASSKAEASAGYGRIPLSFEANRGQADADVDSVANGQGYQLLLREGEAELRLSAMHSGTAGLLNDSTEPSTSAVVRMRLSDANRKARVQDEDELITRSSYFIGNDPAKWHDNVPNFGRVRYSGVYPGIDLVYYGNHRELEHDFVVAPGADPLQIRFSLSGAKNVQLEKRSGDLVLATAAGELRLRKPVTYQTISGKRVEVESQYVLAESGEVSFQLGSYDKSASLVIDPTLSYSTVFYLASSSIAVDSTGCVYFATSTPYGAGSYVVVYKMNPGGSALVYTAVFGGLNSSSGSALAVDSFGDVFVTGVTYSANFPTVNPVQSVKAGTGPDAFVTKLNPYGNKLLYSTYLGGTAADSGSGIAIDTLGQAYVTGSTSSTDFPTHLSLQAALAGATNAFVASFSADGGLLRYSTYLGGSGTDVVHGIGVDSKGDAIVGGVTNSGDFPTHNALQATLSGGQDGFVAAINPSGSALIYSTFLGGSGQDDLNGVAADASGNAYITGATFSTDFPLSNAFQTTGPNFADVNNGQYPDGASYAFVTKINPTGSAFVYSTYLGGYGLVYFDYPEAPFDYGNQAYSITADSSGNAYVAGYTFAFDFPVSADAFQSVNNGTNPDCGSNAYVTELNPSGSALVYSSYFGGNSGGHDGSGVTLCSGSGGAVGTGVAVDPLGSIYLSGIAGWPHSGFPITQGAFIYQSSNQQPFLAKFAFVPTTNTLTSLATSLNPQGVGQAIAFTATVKTWAAVPVTTGTVRFTVDGANAGNVGLTAAGTSTLVVPTLTQGDHQIKAAYSGTTTINSSAGYLTQMIRTTIAPLISPASGTYTKAISISMKGYSPTSVIRFTTSGANPNTSSPVYTAPFVISKSMTIKAFATDTGRANSKVTINTYVITAPAATPAFSPVAGTYLTAQSVTITDSTAGSTIYYTTNGTTPTTASTKYTAPVQVTVSKTIKAIAVATGYQTSAVASEAYVIEVPAASPTFSPIAGHYTTAQTIAISTTTPNATIYLTLNGTTPTTSSTHYTGAIRVTRGITIKAMAVARGYLNSSVSTAVYTIP